MKWTGVVSISAAEAPRDCACNAQVAVFDKHWRVDRSRGMLHGTYRCFRISEEDVDVEGWLWVKPELGPEPRTAGFPCHVDSAWELANKLSRKLHGRDAESLNEYNRPFYEELVKMLGERPTAVLPPPVIKVPPVDRARLTDIAALGRRVHAFLCGLSPFLDDARVKPETQREYLYVVREFGKLINYTAMKREAEIEKSMARPKQEEPSLRVGKARGLTAEEIERLAR